MRALFEPVFDLRPDLILTGGILRVDLDEATLQFYLSLNGTFYLQAVSPPKIEMRFTGKILALGRSCRPEAQSRGR